MTEIHVYSKPACVQCNMTYKAFDAKLTPYETTNIYEDAVALEKVKALGYLQAPVVVVTKNGEITDHWSGFRPDRIDQVVSVINA